MIFMSKLLSYYALSTRFPTVLDLTNQTLVVQYELRHQEHVDCGGSYIKLFNDPTFEPAVVSNETQYSVMFGPDVCGYDKKVHFIFKATNQKGEVVEHHLKDRPHPKEDTLTHLYTLIARPNNTAEILIDGESVKKVSLIEDFDPPLVPPKEIPDPTDVKPTDWVDQDRIDDPDAKKPEDWDDAAPALIPDPEKLEPPQGWLVDEPATIPDPDERKPDDWDDAAHGEWEPQSKIPNPRCKDAPGCGKYEPPRIRNPAYKGRWRPPRIPNPEYKGPWVARLIPNPDYVELDGPHNFGKIFGAGFEDWMVSRGVGFANVYIGTDVEAVNKWNDGHFIQKAKVQEEEKKRIDSVSTPTPIPSPEAAEPTPETAPKDEAL
jgi:calnexin